MRNQSTAFPKIHSEMSELCLSPSESLRSMKSGNKRFLSKLIAIDSLININQIRELNKSGQHPIAMIITCSDSRVPTETIFDQGLGRLYVLRVAGNILSELSLAGVDYALTYFKIPLIVVLGHSHCGAVHAAYEHLVCSKEKLPSTCLQKLVDGILISSRNPKNEADLNWKSIQRTVKEIKNKSEIAEKLLKNGSLKIVGATYDIKSGRVEFRKPKFYD